MATKKKPFTEAQMKEHVKKIQQVVEAHKKSIKKGETFTSITDEEAKEKLGRVNSPMIVSQGWGSGAPGATINYSIGIFNPDPVAVGSLLVHVFFGSGNSVPDPGLFLLNVDTRWPRLTQVPTVGFSLAPGASTTLNFSIRIPNVEPSGYLGNAALFRASFHDTGTFLDRSIFIVQVN